MTLQVHDLKNKGKDNDGLEPGGRRRVILLGAADGVKESRELVEHFCDALQLWRVEQEMIVIGDAKMCNCFLVITFHLNDFLVPKCFFSLRALDHTRAPTPVHIALMLASQAERKQLGTQSFDKVFLWKLILIG